ncbi:PCYCGC motif-containing (lipo)protein [Paenibacillus sp. S-38]|uniref:PCYCGC motif-containing (lipo)protein n=1 Tax=Paenibacillus sp. S-38 TaxID=3416710 RepID=UPI003CF93E24
MAACGSKSSPEPAAHAGAHHGDLQEKTASVDVLPTFLKTQPEQTQLIYKIAGQTLDKLQWIPCYCGCGDEAGHQSNKNCFVKEVNDDGSVVWDDHGTRCGVCMEIAVTTAQLSKDGKLIKEIRNIIDSQYSKGYAKPTETPMPL